MKKLIVILVLLGLVFAGCQKTVYTDTDAMTIDYLQLAENDNRFTAINAYSNMEIAKQLRIQNEILEQILVEMKKK